MTILPLLSLLLTLGQTVRVEQEHPRFSLQLPVGYAPVKEEPQSRFYLKENRPIPGVRFVATISILSGLSPEGIVASRREELAQELVSMLAPSSRVTSAVRTMSWKGLPIEVLDLRFSKDGQRLLASMAFIPTMENAVRVEVLGPENLESEVITDLGEIVKSFEGKASWILPEHHRLASLAFLPTAVSLLGFPVYVLAWLIFFRRKPLRLRHARTAYMLLMGGLMLLPPLLWWSWLGDSPLSPPRGNTWPLPFFFAAPWLMWATARLAAITKLPSEPPGSQDR